MYNLEDGEQNSYVCVEGGHVASYVELTPGQRWTSQLLLTVEEFL